MQIWFPEAKRYIMFMRNQLIIMEALGLVNTHEYQTTKNFCDQFKKIEVKVKDNFIEIS